MRNMGIVGKSKVNNESGGSVEIRKKVGIALIKLGLWFFDPNLLKNNFIRSLEKSYDTGSKG